MGNSSALTFWLEEGGDVNGADKNGFTALHWASCNGDAATVRQLLAAGANPFKSERPAKEIHATACRCHWPNSVEGEAAPRREKALEVHIRRIVDPRT
jgi:hypothetical protein